MVVVSTHHIPCLGANQDSIVRISNFITKSGVNMTKFLSCIISYIFFHFMRLTPLGFLEVNWLNSHIFHELYECKDLGDM